RGARRGRRWGVSPACPQACPSRSRMRRADARDGRAAQSVAARPYSPRPPVTQGSGSVGRAQEPEAPPRQVRRGGARCLGAVVGAVLDPGGAGEAALLGVADPLVDDLTGVLLGGARVADHDVHGWLLGWW